MDAWFPPPLVDGDAPDPHVAVVPDGYVLTTTEVAGVHVPLRISSDLASWSDPVDALPELPGWAEPGRCWAPSITAVPGGWTLHATLRVRGSHQQALGVAVADRPVGPFSAVETPLEQPGGGTWAIDGSPWRAPDGTPWLTWKSDVHRGRTSVLLARPLAEGGTTWADGSRPVELLRSAVAWEADVVEAPCLVTTAAGLWLLYSGHRWPTDGYGVGVAWGPGPQPAALVRRTVDGPWIGSGHGRAGPGGQEAFVDHDGRRRLVLHAWEPGRVGYEHGGARRAHLLDLGTSLG